jgi:hypothetical protein
MAALSIKFGSIACASTGFTVSNINYDGRLPADLSVTVLKNVAVGTHGKALVIER